VAVIDEALERANRNWVRDEDKAHERGDAMALATEVDRLRSRLYYIELIAAKAKGRLPCASTREVMGEEAGDGK